MKKISFLILALFLCHCGDDPSDTTTTESSSTATTTGYANLTISGVTPSDANGALTVTSVVESDDPYTYGRLITIQGSAGDYQHVIRIAYTTYFRSYIEYGTVQSVTHTWGSDLSQPDGIAACEIGGGIPCTMVTVYPDTHTVVFSNLVLFTTPDESTITGSAIY